MSREWYLKSEIVRKGLEDILSGLWANSAFKRIARGLIEASDGAWRRAFQVSEAPEVIWIRADEYGFQGLDAAWTGGGSRSRRREERQREACLKVPISTRSGKEVLREETMPREGNGVSARRSVRL
jgi:hypothetical protein